jgi:hypothetical protein
MRQRVPMGVAASGTGSTLGGTGGTINASLRDHYHAQALTVSISHDHGNAAGAAASAGGHNHGPLTATNFLGDGAGTAANITVGGGGYVLTNLTTTNGAHAHDVDIPAFSGNSSSVTGTIGASSGVNGDTARTAAEANMPFLAANWIIAL